MAKMGRKTKYDTIDLVKLEDLAGKGFIDEELAHLLGIATSTLYEYKKRTEFSEALKRGKATMDEKVIHALHVNALGGFRVGLKERYRRGQLIEKHETFAKPDVIAQIFWLKNRRKEDWRDRQDLNLTLREYKYVELKHESTDKLKEESERIAEAIIASRGRACVPKGSESP